MGDSVNIEVSGEMEPPPQVKKTYFNFAQLGQKITPSTLLSLISAQRQSVRPWMLFVQTSNFKVPTTVPRLSKRLVRNLSYFQSNYLYVFVALFIYCLITSPFLLIAIVGSLVACYKFKTNPVKWKIGNYELTLAHQYALVALCCMPIFLWAGAGSALFWVLGASITVISLHAGFYNIDAIVTEDSEDQFQLLEEV